jgi:hypothetical protein
MPAKNTSTLVYSSPSIQNTHHSLYPPCYNKHEMVTGALLQDKKSEHKCGSRAAQCKSDADLTALWLDLPKIEGM